MLAANVHSQALMQQWERAKALRDPNVVMKSASNKGLTVIQSDTAGLTSFMVIGNKKCLLQGNLAIVAAFVEDYSVVAALQ